MTDTTPMVTVAVLEPQPPLIADRRQIRFTDQDRGLYIIRLTNGSWPA